MGKKELFINAMTDFMSKNDFDTFVSNYEQKEDILSFWEAFTTGKSIGGFTENGQKILTYMQEHYEEYSSRFKAKDIAEGLFMSSRSVSGAMRKLITDGYVTKIAGNPVIYEITNEGKEVTF